MQWPHDAAAPVKHATTRCAGAHCSTAGIARAARLCVSASSSTNWSWSWPHENHTPSCVARGRSGRRWWRNGEASSCPAHLFDDAYAAREVGLALLGLDDDVSCNVADLTPEQEARTSPCHSSLQTSDGFSCQVFRRRGDRRWRGLRGTLRPANWALAPAEVATPKQFLVGSRARTQRGSRELG